MQGQTDLMASMHCDASGASLNVIWKRRYVCQWETRVREQLVVIGNDDLLTGNQEELSLDAGSGCRPLHHDTLPSEEGPGPIGRRTFGMSAKMKRTVAPSLPKMNNIRGICKAYSPTI